MLGFSAAKLDFFFGQNYRFVRCVGISWQSLTILDLKIFNHMVITERDPWDTNWSPLRFPKSTGEMNKWNKILVCLIFLRLFRNRQEGHCEYG